MQRQAHSFLFPHCLHSAPMVSVLPLLPPPLLTPNLPSWGLCPPVLAFCASQPSAFLRHVPGTSITAALENRSWCQERFCCLSPHALWALLSLQKGNTADRSQAPPNDPSPLIPGLGSPKLKLLSWPSPKDVGNAALLKATTCPGSCLSCVPLDVSR